MHNECSLRKWRNILSDRTVKHFRDCLVSNDMISACAVLHVRLAIRKTPKRNKDDLGKDTTTPQIQSLYT